MNKEERIKHLLSEQFELIMESKLLLLKLSDVLEKLRLKNPQAAEKWSETFEMVSARLAEREKQHKRQAELFSRS